MEDQQYLQGWLGSAGLVVPVQVAGRRTASCDYRVPKRNEGRYAVAGPTRLRALRKKRSVHDVGVESRARVTCDVFFRVWRGDTYSC